MLSWGTQRDRAIGGPLKLSRDPRSGAKSLRVRISTDAKFAWQMPKCVKEAKLVSENPTIIDLQIIFRASRRKPTRYEAAGVS
jgi:hypothetical protein